MNKCNDCKNMVVLCALSTSNCKKCNKEITTPHIPSYEYCEECAKELSVCQQCGKKI